MGIKMVWDPSLDDGLGRGGYLPRFYCDFCKEPIDDAEQGIVTWARPMGQDVAMPNNGFPAVCEIAYFAHQGHCDTVLQTAEKAKGNYTLWSSLLEFPIHLANSSTPQGRTPPYRPLVLPTKYHPNAQSSAWQYLIDEPERAEDGDDRR